MHLPFRSALPACPSPKKRSVHRGRARLSIRYLYSAEGAKLQQIVQYADGQKEVTTYASGLQYFRPKGYGTSRLDFIPHAERRTKTVPGDRYVQQYDIKDHLGNTRVTFNAEATTTTFLATMEIGIDDSVALAEEQLFDNIEETRQTLDYHNATEADSLEPEPNKVALVQSLDGSEQAGPGFSLAVSAGDSVQIAVLASYEAAPAASPATAARLLPALAGKPSQGQGEAGTVPAAVHELLAVAAATSSKAEAVPKAHLNFVLIDTAGKVIDKGFVALTEKGKVDFPR